MTRSKEYQKADAFKRYLLRQLYAAKSLIKKGWNEKDCPLPISQIALESLIKRYGKETSPNASSAPVKKED
jgi:hypothetical protein